MAALKDFDDEFVQRISEATADFIRSVEDEWDSDLPTRDVYIPEDGRIVKKEISWPPGILQVYEAKRSEALRPVAEWIEANPDRSYAEEVVFAEPLNYEQQSLADLVADPEPEQLIDKFERDLLGLAGDIVEYTGDLRWERGVFDRAAENFLAAVTTEISSERVLEDFRVLFPLIDFEVTSDSIELDPSIEMVDRREGEWVSAIEISELTPLETAAIYTISGRRRVGEDRLGDTTHAIKIDIRGSPHGTDDRQLRDSVITALRLFRPGGVTVHADKGYQLKPGPLQYREGIPDVIMMTPPMSSPTVPYFGGTYKLSKTEEDEFKDFWQTYISELNPKADTSVGRALRRFNYVHQRSNLEDRVIDCAVALEGTLLRDINPGSSLTFRLMLRSGLLLDNHVALSREQVREIFRAIYVARGDIVHRDQQIDQIMEGYGEFKSFDDRNPTGREFVLSAQKLLGDVLLRYIIESVENGSSVTEVNQEIDRAGLDATYPVADVNEE